MSEATASLEDRLGRPLRDLRISVTDRCNYRCTYCMPSEGMEWVPRAEILTFEELGLPPVVRQLINRTRGLILVTGPTGSGKSTTLATMIDTLNTTRKGHIITIEDPIEFIHRHQNCMINQREVGADTKSFTAALKYALRQDPDVILIGEMRDLETISAALTIAETTDGRHRPVDERVDETAVVEVRAQTLDHEGGVIAERGGDVLAILTAAAVRRVGGREEGQYPSDTVRAHLLDGVVGDAGVVATIQAQHRRLDA